MSDYITNELIRSLTTLPSDTCTHILRHMLILDSSFHITKNAKGLTSIYFTVSNQHADFKNLHEVPFMYMRPK